MFEHKSPPIVPSTTSISRPEWLAPLPLLPGEDRERYDLLYSQLTQAIEPTGAIEKMLVADCVDESWEIQRYRRQRDQLITAAMREGLYNILLPLTGASTADEVSKKWQIGAPEGVQAVERFLNDSKFTIDTIAAAAFDVKRDVVKMLDDMITMKTANRTLLVREIDRRHQPAVGRALREFESPASKTLEHEGAADDQPAKN